MAIGTVASRFLRYPETALSLTRPLKLQMPKGMTDSESLVLEMIQIDASNGFENLIPEGSSFVEISMTSSMLHTYKKAYESHPNVKDIPPMQIVKRGSLNHINAIIKGGVVFVEED